MKLLLTCESAGLRQQYRDFPRRSEDAGVDLFCPHEVVIPRPSVLKGRGYLVDLEVVCEMRGEGGSVSYFLEPRSSLAKYPLSVANSHGIIDSGYRGTIRVALRNHSYDDEEVVIQENTRLVQLCSATLEPIELVVVDDVSALSLSARGTGGFGSTGV